jgi:two-component system, chemotaxis family, sensor histidine kinase and response regulator PixL
MPNKSPLIVHAEDDAALRHVFQKMFTKEGFEVIQAENGIAALDLIQKFRDQISVILSDYQMGGMTQEEKTARDGLTLIHKLQMDSRFGSIPTVLMTGAVEKMKQAALERGVELRQVRIFEKPILPGLLIREIRKLCDGSAA